MAEQLKTQEVKELVRLKASELVTRFTEYLKDKTVCEGRIRVEAVHDETGYAAVLKAATGKSNAEYRLGSRLLRAYYDEEQDNYRLKRYAQPVGPRHGEQRQTEYPVGNYRNADELMKAVADEIAKL